MPITDRLRFKRELTRAGIPLHRVPIGGGEIATNSTQWTSQSPHEQAEVQAVFDAHPTQQAIDLDNAEQQKVANAEKFKKLANLKVAKTEAQSAGDNDAVAIIEAEIQALP